MPPLHVVRVFTTADGGFGNPLGVFLDGRAVPEERRQAVAHDLGYSETAFVDDPAAGALRIYTPAMELALAGHPLVGTAWLLRREREPVEVLRPPAGAVTVRTEAELTFIAARPEWLPAFELVELASPGEVDRLEGAPEDRGWAYCWAWEDEEAGRVRARSFVSGAGVPEDEATGAAALALVAHLRRPLRIRQGRGSDLFARPLEDRRVEVGGRVELDEVRDYPL